MRPALGHVFNDIYQRNAWQGTDTRSGPGSSSEATRRTRVDVASLVAELHIASVVDAACGEGLWQPELPGYIGLDVAPEAIATAFRAHPEREYRVHDVRESCPKADLVILRDAIQHLSLRDGVAVLASIHRSYSRWLLASTFIGGENTDVPTGGAYSPDLEASPFGMPPALRLYHDGWAYDGSHRLRDQRKMLGLWRL